MKIAANIGDEVWVPSANTERIWETCPDCLGTARWNVSLPNGEAFQVECPRCYPGGFDCSTGRIGERYEVVGKATKAKIVGIEVRADRVEYRTDAGYIYDTEDLCHDEASAVARSIVKTQAYVDAEFARMDEHRRKRGRPRRNKDGQREANDNTYSSAGYARAQVRSSIKEARRWIAYAKRKGTKIDLESMVREVNP